MKDRRMPLTETRRHGDTGALGEEAGIEGEELRGLNGVVDRDWASGFSFSP
jgi:hypothetical protein